MLNFLRNRKKAILGLIAGAVVYLAAKAGLDVDSDTAAIVAGGIFAAVVERAQPIFGRDVSGPTVAGPTAPVVVEVAGEQRAVRG